MWIRRALAVCVWLLGAAPALALPLVNGGFELPALDPGVFVLITPGTEPAGFGWIVASGSIDVSHQPNAFIAYDAYEGNQSLDLNGNGWGEIYQDFATTPGQGYILSFAYADNSIEGGTSTADILVTDVNTAVSLLSDSVSHSTSTNGPPPDADWQLYAGGFVATGATTRLRFVSTSPSGSPSGGIVLDAVAVNVPEPGTLILAAGGLIVISGLALRRRRRRATGG